MGWRPPVSTLSHLRFPEGLIAPRSETVHSSGGLWEPERGQGTRWLGRRASEKTSWRRQESQVCWSRREERGRYLRRGHSLGRGVAGERTGGSILPLTPITPCASLRAISPDAHGSLLRCHSAPTAGGALEAPKGAILLGWPQSHTAQPGRLEGRAGGGSVRGQCGGGAPPGGSKAVGISWSGQCFIVHPVVSPEPPDGPPHRSLLLPPASLVPLVLALPPPTQTTWGR